MGGHGKCALWSAPPFCRRAGLPTGDESRTGLAMAAIRGNRTVSPTNVTNYGGWGGSLQRGFLDLFPPLALHGVVPRATRSGLARAVPRRRTP